MREACGPCLISEARGELDKGAGMQSSAMMHRVALLPSVNACSQPGGAEQHKEISATLEAHGMNEGQSVQPDPKATELEAGLMGSGM